MTHLCFKKKKKKWVVTTIDTQIYIFWLSSYSATNVLGSTLAFQSLFLMKKIRLSDSLSPSRLASRITSSPSSPSLLLCFLFLLLVLSFKKTRGCDERERPRKTERKSKRSKRGGDREFERMNLGERDRRNPQTQRSRSLVGRHR